MGDKLPANPGQGRQIRRRLFSGRRYSESERERETRGNILRRCGTQRFKISRRCHPRLLFALNELFP